MYLASDGMAVRTRQTNKGEETMYTENTALSRVLAAAGSVAMTLAIMVSYFAAPATTIVSGVVA